MRFGLLHRVFLDALAVLGLFALACSGMLDRAAVALLLVLFPLALVVPAPWQERPAFRLASTYAPVVFLLLQLVRWIHQGDFLKLALEFAAGLQVLRLLTRRGAAHDSWIIALALVHVVAATMLGHGLLYGLCFLAFLLIAPPALLLSHLRREVEGNYRQGARDRTGFPVDVPRILRSRRVVKNGFLLGITSLSLPIFLFTAILFLLFPRIGLSLLLLEPAPAARLVGFSDRVDLGGVGRLRSDPAVAMRLTYRDLPPDPPPRLALYLRGTGFDHYDGRAWSRTARASSPIERIGHTFPLSRYPDPARDRHIVVDLAPIDPPLVFVPISSVALELLPVKTSLAIQRPELTLGPEGEIRYHGLRELGGPRYRVFQPAAPEPQPPPAPLADRGRYLQLPASLSPDLLRLARRWTAGSSTPEQMVLSVRDHLRSEYRYDLDSPSGASSDPLRHFLLTSKRGHCEYYSTAMAVLLRTVGVPTRNVTGFVGASYNRFGHFYVVRQGDAHSWVEVWTDGHGWVPYDPTPPASTVPQSDLSGWFAVARELLEAASQRWSHHVEGYDLQQQFQIYRLLQRGVSALRLSQRGAVSWVYYALGAGLTMVFLAAVAARYLRRWRQRQATDTPPRDRELDAVRLYRKLDNTLSDLGFPRHVATPPLAHARAIDALASPVAGEVMDLTRRYLRARFGGEEFSSHEAREYLARVRRLRHTARTVDDLHVTSQPPAS